MWGIEVLLIHLLFALVPETDAQIRTTITPNQVVLTSYFPPLTRISCSIDPDASIKEVFNIQLLVKRESENDFQPIAEVLNESPRTPTFLKNAPHDMELRGTISGGISRIKPEASTLTLVLDTFKVKCSDEGQFECSLTYQSTLSNVQTVRSRENLALYSLPGDAIIKAMVDDRSIHGRAYSRADVKVGETVEFTCSAAIGSDPSTKLKWRQTTAHGKVNYFVDYTPPTGTFNDGTPSSTLTDCSYSRHATMRYQVTVADANRENPLAFQCYVSVIQPNGQGVYVTQNPPTFYINPISVALMSLSPYEVVLTSKTPQNTTLTCSVSDRANVTHVGSMQILHKQRNQNGFTALAEVESIAPKRPRWSNSVPHNVSARGTVSGAIRSEDPQDSLLRVTMATRDVLCTDIGLYRCSLSFRDEKGAFETFTNTRMLSVYTLPTNLRMEAKVNGQTIQGTRKMPVAVGEMVMFTCSAMTGSDRSTKIKWKRTIAPSKAFVDYDSSAGRFDDGVPSYSSTQCSYYRTATMWYNVTMADLRDGNDLAFKCYISVIPPNGQGVFVLQTKSAPYIKPINATHTTAHSTTQGASTYGLSMQLMMGSLGTVFVIRFG